MTYRRDVDALAAANRAVVTLVRRDLGAFFASLNLSRPEAARDALVGFLPRLVQTYGDVAATVAAEWYETVRARQVGGSFTARLASPAPAEQSAKGARYASRHLFTDDPAQTLGVLSGAVQRYVLGPSRETVAVNAQRDRARFARVPVGAKTCAFCSMMSSRGFVYTTREAAGAFSDWHDDCDCQVVVEWDADSHGIDGYDPDSAYDKYLSARAATGSSDPRVILAEMRRQFPDDFTDGVTPVL